MIKVIGVNKDITMRKISDTSDFKQGDVLHDPETGALFEVLSRFG